MSDDDFDGGMHDAQPEPGAKRKAGKVTVLKMRKALKVQIDAALHALAALGPFSQEQAVAAMQRVLADVDLNSYKSEFAQRIAGQEVHQRHGNFSKILQLMSDGQFDMFTEELAENVLLPAEEGKHISLSRAKWSHIMFKLTEQEQNVERAVAALSLTREVFEPYRATMEPDPSLEFREVMYRKGNWRSGPAAA